MARSNSSFPAGSHWRRGVRRVGRPLGRCTSRCRAYESRRSAPMIWLQRSAAAPGLVPGFTGFEGLEVWRSDRGPDEVITVSRWRDRGCFRDHMRSAAHRASHGRIGDDLRPAIKLERLEHLRGGGEMNDRRLTPPTGMAPPATAMLRMTHTREWHGLGTRLRQSRFSTRVASVARGGRGGIERRVSGASTASHRRVRAPSAQPAALACLCPHLSQGAVLALS